MLHRPLFIGAFFALLLALSTNTALASHDDGDYERRDDLTRAVVSCEEAYARLQNCCAGYRAWVGFDEKKSPCLDLEFQRTSSGGCNGPTEVRRGDTEPLALAESECIRAHSCEELEAAGVCTRAANDPTIDNETGRPATRRLCP